MLTPADYDDIIVTVAHPWADIETTLRHWIETGPGPRSFVTITAPRRRNGDPVPLGAIPLQYHNSSKVGGCSTWPAPRRSRVITALATNVPACSPAEGRRWNSSG